MQLDAHRHGELAGDAERSPRQSGRLPVISSSSTWSPIGSWSSSGAPTLHSRGSSMIPSCSVESPSSRSLSIIPRLSTPRSFASLDLHAVGHRAARQHHRDRVARREVGGAAHDLAQLALADVDLRHAQAVGVRVLLEAVDATDLEVARRRRASRSGRRRPARCASTVGAADGEQLGDCVRVVGQRPGRARGARSREPSLQQPLGTRVRDGRRTGAGSAGRSGTAGAGRGSRGAASRRGRCRCRRRSPSSRVGS